MYKYLLPALILGTLALTGCARHAQIIVDPQGIDMGLYQKDLAECERLADQVHSKVAQGIVGGAIVGALVGEIFGGRRNSTVRTSQLGALSGGLQGGSDTMHERERVLKNCLSDRGYRILN